jgi:hypothetical protein
MGPDLHHEHHGISPAGLSIAETGLAASAPPIRPGLVTDLSRGHEGRDLTGPDTDD